MLRIEEYFEESNLNKSRSLSYNIAEHFHGMFIPNKGVGTEFLFIALFGYWSSMIVHVGPVAYRPVQRVVFSTYSLAEQI